MNRRRRSRFSRDQRGGVAIFFGFALPVLLVGAGAALEYASLAQRRAQLQKAADTAALTAARELTLANADDARVKSVAQAAAIASLKGDLATLNFKSDTTISLSAPKTGLMAGLLVYGDPKAIIGRKFHIQSDNARKLLGTIYLPRGSLFVDSKKPVADQSAYTVIVARTIELEAGPNLVMNANYGSTDVPVPIGVGPIGANVSLSQ
jgi:hypothetical protein